VLSDKSYVAENGEVVLRFNIADLEPLMRHAREAPGVRIFDTPGVPGLVIVADRGVYLVSNGDPPQELRPGAKPMRLQVSYALGCNPSQDPFDSWWPVHNAIDEGNDFASLIALSSFEESLSKCTRQLVVVTGPDHFTLYADVEWDARVL
jgi:hypothetical protein